MQDLPQPLDIIILCVKAYDLPGALEQIQTVVRPDTILLPLLNGVDICQRIRGIITAGMVLPACVWIGAYIQEPGLVVENGGARMALGKDPAYPGFDPGPVLEILELSGLRYQWFEDPKPAIWEKYTLVAAFALVTARYGFTMGQVLQDPTARQQAMTIMQEIISLAHREGVPLPTSLAEDILNKVASFPPENSTSYQRDVWSGRGSNEGELFGGTILRLGAKHGVPTPVTEALYRDIGGRFRM